LQIQYSKEDESKKVILLGKFPIADHVLSSMKICRKCKARNKVSALKCRKCGSSYMRPKRKEKRVKK
jgi:large subunit ribosomal protein L40e